LITCKKDLSECFRIFTNPDRISRLPAQRFYTHGIHKHYREVTIYTDGTCLNNGKQNTQCGSGIWFANGNVQNQSIHVPGEKQSNQVSKIVAIIKAISAVLKFWPLKMMTDSKYAIDGLTTNLKVWEDRGWIGIKNTPFFQRAAYLLKHQTATTTFQWVKGHNGKEGNEESDTLTKEGATKDNYNPLELEIPKEFDIQGAKLATATQAIAYAGIREHIPPSKDLKLK
jgi:ribonuclease HI